jgi:hypothetical protein
MVISFTRVHACTHYERYIIIIHIVTILCSQKYNIIHISLCSHATGNTRVPTRLLYHYYSHCYHIMNSNIVYYTIIIVLGSTRGHACTHYDVISLLFILLLYYAVNIYIILYIYHVALMQQWACMYPHGYHIMQSHIYNIIFIYIMVFQSTGGTRVPNKVLYQYYSHG